VDGGRILARAIVMGTVVALVGACGGSPPASPSPTVNPTHSHAVASSSVSTGPTSTPSRPPSTSPPAGPTTTPVGYVSPLHDSDLACAIGQVEAAETNAAPVTPVTDCAPQPRFSKRIRNGGLVTTDPCGEAILDSKCGTVYVFQDSEMRFSACDRQTTTAAGCITGTMAWDNTCPEGVASIVSPPARLDLHGTWISATYLPQRQIALFTVLEGEARAIPIDATGAPIGDGVDVPAGTFWFGGINGQPATVAGLEEHQAYAIERLPAVVEELQLASVMAAISRQATSDGVRSTIDTPNVINIRARGGPFDKVDVQQALLLAMDWRTAAKVAYPDGNGRIYALIGDIAPGDTASLSRDFAAAAKAIEAAGLTDTTVNVVADEDAAVRQVVDRYLGVLKELRLTPRFGGFLAPEKAAKQYEDLGSKGEPTIWLSTQ